MQVEIECPVTTMASQRCRLRAILFNNSYEPIAVLRSAFFGPTIANYPEAIEPTVESWEEVLVLKPFTFYGRERSYDNLVAGEMVVVARYRDPESGLNLEEKKTLTVVPS